MEFLEAFGVFSGWHCQFFKCSSYLGILMTFISFVAIIFIIVRKLIFGDPVSGWPSLVCIITFVGGIQLFCMGIMGQYLSKTYMEVKKRPHYIIQKSKIVLYFGRNCYK